MIVLQRDPDGDWPAWVYEWAGKRLVNVGGTHHCQHQRGLWADPVYRMQYIAIVLRAIEQGYLAQPQQ